MIIVDNLGAALVHQLKFCYADARENTRMDRGEAFPLDNVKCLCFLNIGVLGIYEARVITIFKDELDSCELTAFNSLRIDSKELWRLSQVQVDKLFLRRPFEIDLAGLARFAYNRELLQTQGNFRGRLGQ